jgi:hypothetical protein
MILSFSASEINDATSLHVKGERDVVVFLAWINLTDCLMSQVRP